MSECECVSVAVAVCVPVRVECSSSSHSCFCVLCIDDTTPSCQTCALIVADTPPYCIWFQLHAFRHKTGGTSFDYNFVFFFPFDFNKNYGLNVLSPYSISMHFSVRGVCECVFAACVVHIAKFYRNRSHIWHISQLLSECRMPMRCFCVKSISAIFRNFTIKWCKTFVLCIGSFLY